MSEKTIKTDKTMSEIDKLIPADLQKELFKDPQSEAEIMKNNLKKKRLPSMITKAVNRLKLLETMYKGGKIKNTEYRGYSDVDPTDPEEITRVREKAQYELLIQKQKGFIRKLWIEYKLQGNEISPII
jgi:hypothetical protein